MSCEVDNNAFEMVITPSRKRKRDSGLGDLPYSPSSTSSKKPSAFTNAAFSSTPKKEIKGLIQKFNRFPPNKRNPLGKENENKFPSDPCMEVKSIFDLVHQKADAEPENPFEVIRKPPKKKKKADIAEACFVNPGLNLEVPERQFNPFEVKRESPTKSCKADEPQCFINPALNIRTEETTAARNPFEIQRINHITETPSNGIENPGLDLTNGQRRIGISFKPTVGCRIDFNNLTPSKMFAEKLIFSPANAQTPQKLSDISEAEEATMDIGRELDLYQLELENSINEAKQRKTNVDGRTFNEKLEDIAESPQEEEEQEPKTPETTTSKSVLKIKSGVLNLEDVDTPPIQTITTLQTTSTESVLVVNKTFVKEQQGNESYTDDEGIDYDDDDDEEDVVDFKVPAPFVRAYRKADPAPLVHTSTESIKSEDDVLPKSETENKSKVKNIIRNSIRKLMHPSKSANDEKKLEKKPLAASSEHHSTGHHIMESIRHSLRRRPQKQTNDMEEVNIREVSIIDTSERKLKLKSNLIQTDYIKIEDLDVEKKPSLRSSIRKSTRDVKNHIMKSVFHKNNEEYAFA